MIQVSGLCVLASLLAIFLRRQNPELAMLLTLCAAVLAFLFLSGLLQELLDFLRELSGETGVDQNLFIPLYKTMGIALVVRVGGNLCRDAGESALAAVIETAGSVCALLVAVPLLRTVLSVLLELMKS